MIEKIWNIVKVEEKTATNGNAYLAITVLGDDGKEHKSTVFDASLFQVFKNNKAIKVQLDKPEGKVQWQVKSAVSVADGLAPPTTPAPPIQQETGRVNTDIKEENQPRDGFPATWENKPDARTLDIHQQVAVKEIGELWRCGHITETDAVNKKLIAWYMNWIYRTVGIDVHYK